MFLFHPNYLFVCHLSYMIAFTFSSHFSVVHWIMAQWRSSTSFRKTRTFCLHADIFELLSFVRFPVWEHYKLKTPIKWICSIWNWDTASKNTLLGPFNKSVFLSVSLSVCKLFGANNQRPIKLCYTLGFSSHVQQSVSLFAAVTSWAITTVHFKNKFSPADTLKLVLPHKLYLLFLIVHSTRCFWNCLLMIGFPVMVPTWPTIKTLKKTIVLNV